MFVTPHHQCWKGTTEYYLTNKLKDQMVQLHIKECEGCFSVFHKLCTNHDLNPKLHHPSFKVRSLKRKANCDSENEGKRYTLKTSNMICLPYCPDAQHKP